MAENDNYWGIEGTQTCHAEKSEEAAIWFYQCLMFIYCQRTSYGLYIAAQTTDKSATFYSWFSISEKHLIWCSIINYREGFIIKTSITTYGAHCSTVLIYTQSRVQDGPLARWLEPLCYKPPGCKLESNSYICLLDGSLLGVLSYNV